MDLFDVLLIGWDNMYITMVTDDSNDFRVRCMCGLIGW